LGLLTTEAQPKRGCIHTDNAATMVALSFSRKNWHGAKSILPKSTSSIGSARRLNQQ
jgi:hypothetical protein